MEGFLLASTFRINNLQREGTVPWEGVFFPPVLQSALSAATYKDSHRPQKMPCPNPEWDVEPGGPEIGRILGVAYLNPRAPRP